MRTSVTPDGTFRYVIHKPSYSVNNLRGEIRIEKLGTDEDGRPVENRANYPDTDIEVAAADWIYEIANPFPFRGTTFIGKSWADRSAENYDRIRLPHSPEVSLTTTFADKGLGQEIIDSLPRPLLLSLATTSTDPEDLTRLARLCCAFVDDNEGNPTGLRYVRDETGSLRAEISDFTLFEAIANNPALPDTYKISMVIRPGAQGASEIVGDFHSPEGTHIYEYLRRNSYIGGGHYAANMADNAIRYAIKDLSRTDMEGLRHLYYQRTYARLAGILGIPVPSGPLSTNDLEALRGEILGHSELQQIEVTATLWGWNFGFDYAPSGYRLHASHQQVHQQYALIPSSIDCFENGKAAEETPYLPFHSGIMIEEIVKEYREKHGQEFFWDFLHAIENNQRMDGRNDLDSSLVIWRDDNVMLFVPKAQTSQWELQLMTLPKDDGSWPGNILETNGQTRRSLDTGLLKAQQALAGRGARMVTSIEFQKRFDYGDICQPLIYCLLPKIPESPGAFSENQLRFINGHYPEDFAAVCRMSLAENTAR